MRTRSLRRNRQQGQAIVLIALLLAVLFGMLGLAIDAGRAYVDRRQLQNAVDAAALGAGDNYENFQSVSSAENWAVNMFAKNLGLSGGSTNPCGGNCLQGTWPDYSFQIQVTPSNFNGNFFVGTATHNLPLAFLQVLGAGPVINVGASATTITGNQRTQPALLALEQGCPNPAPIAIGGNTTLTVKGDVYSDGCATNTGTATFGIAGSFYTGGGSPPAANYLCYSTNPSTPPYPPTAGVCNPGDSLGHAVGSAPYLPDPKYPSLGFSFYNSPSPTAGGGISHGSWIEDKPGDYGGIAIHAAGCYFLDPGIYIMSGGYSSTGALTSNELKPPDEALYNDGSQPATPQFWDAQSCAGHFTVASVNVGGGNGLNQGNGKCLAGPGNNCWGVVLASGRADAYPPTGQPGSTSYTRGSAPSVCKEVAINNSGSLGLQVTITANAPGAQYYKAYLSPNGCKGPAGAAFDPTSFGETLQFSESDAVPNSVTIQKAQLPASFGPGQCFPSTAGCSLPDAEQAPQCFTNCPPPQPVPQEVPARKLLPGGDRADENTCYPQSAARAGFPCDGALVTPGAVQFYIGGGCLSENGNGGTWVFSGYQYNWLVVYEPSSNSSCGNTLNGGANTSYIGTIYTPTSSWTINGNDHAPLAGQVVCYQATVNGNSTIGINFNPDFAPAPPASRLIQ